MDDTGGKRKSEVEELSVATLPVEKTERRSVSVMRADLRSVFREVPANRSLTETDSQSAVKTVALDVCCQTHFDQQGRSN